MILCSSHFFMNQDWHSVKASMSRLNILSENLSLMTPLAVKDMNGKFYLDY